MNTKPTIHCVVCKESLGDDYSIASFWNVPVHPHHSRCSCCGYPTEEHGRKPLCIACRPTAVETTSVANERGDAVRAELERRGLRLGDRGVRFALARAFRTKRRIRGRAVPPGSDSSRSSASRPGDYEVQILTGLPAIEYDAISAHELTHVWFMANGVSPKPLVSEGVSELTAYWLLGRVGGSRAKSLRAQIASNPDPVYGTGFRLALQAEKRHGWHRVTTTLLRTGALPR